jgi:hypothetical protein
MTGYLAMALLLAAAEVRSDPVRESSVPSATVAAGSGIGTTAVRLTGTERDLPAAGAHRLTLPPAARGRAGLRDRLREVKAQRLVLARELGEVRRLLGEKPPEDARMDLAFRREALECELLETVRALRALERRLR